MATVYPIGTERTVTKFILTKEINGHRRWFTYTAWKEEFMRVKVPSLSHENEPSYVSIWVPTEWLVETEDERARITMADTTTGGY